MPDHATASGTTRSPGPPGDLLGSRSRDRVGSPDQRIVVLDDDPTNVLLLSRILRGAGYTRVVTRTDPAVATEEMLGDPPDLLLLDMRMPRMDGYAVLQRLGPLLGSPHELAVLVLTADLTTETRHRALGAGAQDFLTKPFDVVEVALRTANLLETVELHRRLRRHNVQLEHAVAERTQELVRLAADLAHEVRTPLYAIRGLVEVLLEFEARLPGGLQEDLGRIDEIAVTALDLVNAEIRGARETAGHVATSLQRVEVTAVLDDLRKMMAHTAPPGKRLVVADGAELPPLVTDPVRLGQILRNLVQNALQVDADGLVEVTAAPCDRGACVAFAVCDPGPGVLPEDRERIFLRFTGEERPAAGGLGLHISRTLARALGGDVTVTGPPRHRSCFTATVATRPGDPPSP